MRRKTILIADDHPLFRRGLRDLIDGAGDFVVAGEASDGEEAVAAINMLSPDIVILDLAMPKRDGLTVAAWAHEHRPETRTIIVTMYGEAAYAERAQALGVAGFILKDDAVQEVFACLDAVAAGRRYFSPTLKLPHAAAPPPLADDLAALERLTAVQRRILRHVADYKTSKDIAAALGISFRTVQNHRARIAEALDLKGPNRLLEFAVRNKSRL